MSRNQTDVPLSTNLAPSAVVTTCHVPCGQAFRRAVLEAAHQRGTTVIGLVRAGLLIANGVMRPEVADPGPGGVETALVTCRDGRVRQFRRQSFLHLRMAPTLANGLDESRIRQILATVLLLGTPGAASLEPASSMATHRAAADTARRLLLTIGQLAFQPIPGGVRSVCQADYVLGLRPDIAHDRTTVTNRFRTLAPLFHPDTGILSDPERLRMLVEARNLLVARVTAPA